jgi:molybdopterin/thiamine biosynthesis adenylyltransferase
MSNVFVRIPEILLSEIKAQLRLPHPSAFERVGFCFGKSFQTINDDWIVVLNTFHPVRDMHYLPAEDVGARISGDALTEAFQHAYSNRLSLFHIHLHDFGVGMPGFSTTDIKSGYEILDSFKDYVVNQVHGIIVLNGEMANCIVLPPRGIFPQKANQFSIVGKRLAISLPAKKVNPIVTDRYSRQKFLGHFSETLISSLRIGIIGLSGGGSHVVQQTAHIGFKKYTLADPEHVDDESNLNRIVTATLQDAELKKSKFEVAERLIKGLHPDADVQGGTVLWQECIEYLKSCDVIFGCVDTVLARRDLENFCRRYLIPFIDIGMGVETAFRPYSMFGQVQLSTPGYSCFTCNGFITEESLAKEANNYGQKTKRPQVVWPNGVLASTAVGVLMQMITNWTLVDNNPAYLSYDGNLNIINNHLNESHRPKCCKHFPIDETGPLSW